MDFIERIFDVAPDGGNGLTELAILLAVACLAAGAVWLLRRRVRLGCVADRGRDRRLVRSHQAPNKILRFQHDAFEVSE